MLRFRDPRPHAGQKYVVAMVNHAMSTPVGTNMTRTLPRRTSRLTQEQKALQLATTSTTSAIMERRNHMVFDAASGCERMSHHEPIASASHRMK